MSDPPSNAEGSPSEGSPDEDPRADLRWGTIPAMVADGTSCHGGREALVDGDRRWTFAQLAEGVTTWTRALMADGVQAGDRVAIWAPNSAEWVLGALGVLGAGGVLVPLNTRFKGPEAAYILRASGAKTLLTVEGFLGLDFPAMLAGEDTGALARTVLLRHDHPPADRGIVTKEALLASAEEVSEAQAAAHADGLGPSDISDLIFTSGTTGRPKGAMTTHAQSLRTFATWSSIVGLSAGDRYLVVNPFFHTFGYKAGMLACLMTGATIVPEPVFDVEGVLARIEAERISVLPGPPTLYQSILSRPDLGTYDLSSLRLGVTGAAAVPVELVIAMRQVLGFTTVLTAYGLTESCGTVTMCRRSDPPEVIATTSGRAIPGLEVQVVDAAGAACPPGEAGEIVVRGYTVMAGYFGDDQATAEAIDGEGWLHTGDIGTLDRAGNVTITDRLKDMFVVGGFNAYPAEIEAMLRGFSEIGQVAVVGVPDERLGEVGCAYIVPSDPGVAPGLGSRVLGWAGTEMANYKVPRYAVVLEALPVNAGGKVLKRELRERFKAGTDDVETTERSK